MRLVVWRNSHLGNNHTHFGNRSKVDFAFGAAKLRCPSSLSAKSALPHSDADFYVSAIIHTACQAARSTFGQHFPGDAHSAGTSECSIPAASTIKMKRAPKGVRFILIPGSR